MLTVPYAAGLIAGAADALIQEAKARGGEAAAMAQRIEGKKSKSAAELGELYIQTLSQLSDAELEALSGGGGRGREGSIPENAPENAAVTESDPTITENGSTTTKTAPRTEENPRIGTDGTRYAPRAGGGDCARPAAEGRGDAGEREEAGNEHGGFCRPREPGLHKP